MSKFVKLKTDTYKELTKNRYYEIADECLDPKDGGWCYIIRRDNMVEYGLYPQGDFEKPISYVRCINNEGNFDSLTIKKMYKIISINYIGGELVAIKDDTKQTGQYSSKRFEFVTEDTSDIPCKREEPKIMLGGTGEKLLKPLRNNFYHITYSLQYAEGVELADIGKDNIVQIEGKIVSKGRTWVIETASGTVIIPFKSIIHMHPQY